MKTRKWLGLLLVVLLLMVALAACGGGGNSNNSNTIDGGANETTGEGEQPLGTEVVGTPAELGGDDGGSGLTTPEP